MSRAGKFIPGGGGGKSARRTGPIRAPDADAPPGTPAAATPPAGKRSLVKGSGLIKPVQKGQRLPIAIMSGIVCCLLVSVAWYTLAYQPTMRQLAAAKQALADAQAAAIQKAQDDAAKAAALLAQQQANEHGILIVDTNPTGATVTVGDFRKKTPARFTDMVAGNFSVLIQADGYEDYRQDVNVPGDGPLDMGTVQLVPKTGDLSLTSDQSNVTYTITGPADYSHSGNVPDKIEKLPVGDYVVNAAQNDWKLAPFTVTVHDHDSQQKEIKFPFADLSITTVPPGATVRQDHNIMGVTPLSLTQLRPQDMTFSVDLPPYTLQRVTVHLPDFGNVTKQITLVQDKDFIAACGMPMVWIADGNYWAGKYLVRQSDYQNVMGNNPSSFRKPNRPVETISWDGAMAYCDKLNQFEKKAGKLPQGYHYTLPTEAQWEGFSADADINQAAMSRTSTLNSTQDVGASEPNKYGLYDTLGNVWEWCLDNFDDKGNHSLRGGSWLSSADNFPGSDTREGGGPTYADRFTGFRVILVPN
jgi:hypothetical protein